jgi:glycosyltransferase involved in cell wall biosynthesis
VSGVTESRLRDDRPRYGIYLSARNLGSRERLLLATARALVSGGASVDILAAGAEAPLREALAVDPQPDLRLVDLFPGSLPAPHKLRVTASIPRLARWIDQCRPAVLFGTSVPPNLACIAAARLSKHSPRLVLRQSNTLRVDAHPRYGNLRRRPRDLLVPRFYARAEIIVAVAAEVADNLSSLGIRTPTLVIPNAVEIAFAAERAREQPDHPWLAEHDRPTLVQIGRLVEKKDQLTLLEAFALVVRDRPARLLIYGEGPMRRTLERRITALGLGDHVALPGFTSNPFAVIARADLFVLSSISEGMPSALIEALACGIPVVSTDCPSGPAEILEGGKVGRLVEVGNASALARAMLETLDAPPRAEALVLRAADFSFERIVRRYVDVLEGKSTPHTHPSSALPDSPA